MRIKNFLSIAAFIICGLVCVNSVKAEGPTNTDNVTVKIKLQPIQTIVVTSAQNTVEFVYKDIDDYANGIVLEAKTDHLTVFSTGGFAVTVASVGENFIRNTGDGTIPVGDVKITASQGSVTTGGTTTFNTVTLAKTPTTSLIEETKGGRGLTYNVVYDNSAGGPDHYINKYFESDGVESVYQGDITYTIAAQ